MKRQNGIVLSRTYEYWVKADSFQVSSWWEIAAMVAFKCFSPMEHSFARWAPKVNSAPSPDWPLATTRILSLRISRIIVYKSFSRLPAAVLYCLIVSNNRQQLFKSSYVLVFVSIHCLYIIVWVRFIVCLISFPHWFGWCTKEKDSKWLIDWFHWYRYVAIEYGRSHNEFLCLWFIVSLSVKI